LLVSIGLFLLDITSTSPGAAEEAVFTKSEGAREFRCWGGHRLTSPGSHSRCSHHSRIKRC
uniref:Secreted protein n=1 Tax=Rodentolepis nana TaxID=102285 RepID=A0A0R3TQP9_RODNA